MSREDKQIFCKMKPREYFVIFITLILFPILTTKLVNTQSPITGWVTTENDWIVFWGSYFGAVLGGIITLFVLVMTLKNNERNLALTLQEERKQHEENKALAIRPYLTASKNDTLISLEGKILNDVTFSYGFRSTEKNAAVEHISLKNIGLGTAVNIKVRSIAIFGRTITPDSQGCRNTWQNNLEVSSVETIAIRLGLDWNKYVDGDELKRIQELIINLSFEDLLGNEYTQSVICKYPPKFEQKDLYGKNLSLELVNNNRLTIECITVPKIKD